MTLPPRAGMAQKNAAEAIDPSGKSLDNPEYPMKKLLLSAAIFAAFSADATCGFTGIPNEVCDQPAVPTVRTDPPVVLAQVPTSAAANSTSSATNAQGQQQRQRQGQAQQQGQRTSQQANGNGAGSGIVTIQGAQSGSGDRLLVLPNIPPTPASTVPGAAIMMTTTACGPQLAIWRQPVTAHYDGIMRHEERQQGWNYGMGPAADMGGDDFRVVNGRVYGHQAIITHAVTSTGYARTLVLGGGSSAGSWGQGGVGGSGANQELVANIQLVPCLISAQEYVRPMSKPVRKVVKHRPAPAPCVMEDKLIRVCKRT